MSSIEPLRGAKPRNPSALYWVALASAGEGTRAYVSRVRLVSLYIITAMVGSMGID